VTIPARPFLGISRDDRDMILDVIEGALDRALRSGPSSAGRRR
jgi:phage gpG-like protein